MTEPGMEIEMTVDIVAAYVSNNSVPSSELADLLGAVHAAVRRLATGQAPEPAPAPRPEPAVPVKKSITPDFLICLEDGKKFKSLRRHLASAYQMTPDQYRQRWDLPASYPMVAPEYAKTRSQLAKQIGLGRPKAEKAKSASKAKKAA